jgi:hypothetical protein
VPEAEEQGRVGDDRGAVVDAAAVIGVDLEAGPVGAGDVDPEPSGVKTSVARGVPSYAETYPLHS